MKNIKSLLIVSVCVITAALLQGCVDSSVYKKAIPGYSEAKFLPAMEKNCFELVNAERRKKNIPELKSSRDLLVIARNHSKDMVYMECLTHRGSDNKTVEARADAENIDWNMIGENVARNRGYDKPAQKAVTEWMKSKGHRANILNPKFTHAAIGIAEGKNDYIYFTQAFMQPMP